jgi:hypothetical protein
VIRVTAPHFVAAVEIDARGVVTRAAPILGYMLGWTREEALRYARRRGWQAEYFA